MHIHHREAVTHAALCFSSNMTTGGSIPKPQWSWFDAATSDLFHICTQSLSRNYQHIALDLCNAVQSLL